MGIYTAKVASPSRHFLSNLMTHLQNMLRQGVGDDLGEKVSARSEYEESPNYLEASKFSP